jgi:hypothetical protein
VGVPDLVARDAQHVAEAEVVPLPARDVQVERSHRLVFEGPLSWRGAALRHLLLVEHRAHAATR